MVTGGLGGFGLALAVWLAKHGARNIVLTSKRGMRTGYQNRIITGLREIGVKASSIFLSPTHLLFRLKAGFGSHIQQLSAIAQPSALAASEGI